MKVLTRPWLVRVLAIVCLVAMAGCGGNDGEAVAAANAAPVTSAAVADSEPGEDHDDEDHDDEDHDDEDHDDEDHDDEDHDDHDDEDHDDHDDEASAGLSAHLHGAAELFVAWSGNDVVIDLVSPANNIFGFEYEPTTDEDIAFVAEQTATLTAPGVIVFNDQAGCQAVGEVETDSLYEGSHSEVTASWMFACSNPDELSYLDTSVLFAEFPGIEDLDAQWASESGQSAAELSVSSALLRFE